MYLDEDDELVCKSGLHVFYFTTLVLTVFLISASALPCYLLGCEFAHYELLPHEVNKYRGHFFADLDVVCCECIDL